MILTGILKMHTEKGATVHSRETRSQKETHGVPRAQTDHINGVTARTGKEVGAMGSGLGSC